MFTVTLEGLRKAGACFWSYNKLVRHLQGKTFTEYDQVAERYITFRHDEPITVLVILEALGLEDALWSLRACPEAATAERVLALGYTRRVQHLITDEVGLRALEVAERFTRGEATTDELMAAKDATFTAWLNSDSASLATEAVWAMCLPRGSALSAYSSVYAALHDSAAFQETAEDEFRAILKESE